MILAGENGAVPFQCRQHLRNCNGSNDLAEGERGGEQSRVRQSADVETEGGGRSGDGGGEGIGDVELGFPIRQPLQRRSVVVVGHALTSKKVESFLQPKLERVAR
ncbi:hypothetical protein MLD38_002016 [Melastoma candidum]|nr:hypothetical protein MLD38_002016 [Melastoma candidum]